jgi:hypothetical protein
MTDEDRALLRQIAATQKSIAESLGDARNRLQIIQGGYLHQLDRLRAIEATVQRLENRGVDIHPREPTSGVEAPPAAADEDLRVVTAADIERALERDG